MNAVKVVQAKLTTKTDAEILGMSERGADFDAKREAYDVARAELARLYDSPDKTVAVQLYRGRLKRAQAAVVKAHSAMLAAY